MRHTISYIAGLFDGEGCFYIARSSVDSKHSSRKYRFQAYASLAIREKKICNFLKSEFGGKVLFIKRNNPKHCDVYKWTINGKVLDNFLNKVSYCLIIKLPQAKVLSKFQNVKKEVSNRPISNKNYKLSENFYNKMKSLNKKGPRI